MRGLMQLLLEVIASHRCEIAPQRFRRAGRNLVQPTYRAVFDHHFTDDVVGYIGYNRGFKSGLFNPLVRPGSPIDCPVAPEIVDSLADRIRSRMGSSMYTTPRPGEIAFTRVRVRAPRRSCHSTTTRPLERGALGATTPSKRRLSLRARPCKRRFPPQWEFWAAGKLDPHRQLLRMSTMAEARLHRERLTKIARVSSICSLLPSAGIYVMIGGRF
jgi:hypothetical protein